MKTIVVIGRQPVLADAVRAVLDPARHRVVHHSDLWTGGPPFNAATTDACLVDAELTDIRPIRLLTQLRRALPDRPLLVYSKAGQAEWEEEAYLAGVDGILTKPVRGRLLATLLDRLRPDSREVSIPAVTRPATAEAAPNATEPLDALREFSQILAHSLETETLLRQFLLLLRRILGINRAAIFLRAGNDSQAGPLSCACGLGFASSLLEQVDLSVDAGIGASVLRSGRILQRGSEEARDNPAASRELELLGVEVAVPILDREALVGVAVFDGRLTGGAFSHAELALLFHLLEELALALNNSRLHDELGRQHGMMSETLDQMGGACLVVAADLRILHANVTAVKWFANPGRGDAPLVFHDLPQALASRIYAVAQSGQSPEPFVQELPARAGEVFQVRLKSFTRGAGTEAVLVMVEDITRAERARRMELESANLRLVKAMAEHLAHEIGNTLVPLNTTEQLMRSGGGADAGDRAELAGVMSESIRRIGRLTSQMQFLSRDGLRRLEEVPLARLIEEAFQEASSQLPRTGSRLQFNEGPGGQAVTGERAALKHALVEVLLNALQATTEPQRVEINVQTPRDAAGDRRVVIEVCDRGSGFSPEAARRAGEPFYSTRAVGLGLGLAVARKILELHGGRLEIVTAAAGKPGAVRLCLPREPVPATAARAKVFP